jgi:hypothetical protein
MAETCYSKGKKVILLPDRKDNGKWVCPFTIPGFKELETGRYQDDRLEEYETEWEAKAAAFMSAKRLIDSSHQAWQAVEKRLQGR